jgi:two-component system chemotaxis response regulator CheB
MEDPATSKLQGHDIVVIGGSAGATEALLELLRQLPGSFPACVFVAYHMPPHAEGVLHKTLAGAGALRVRLAEDGDPVRHGVVYVARPDRHLLVDDGVVRVVRGPRENHWRPAIDPLFRSAAVAYGSRVIAVVLTGRLDDGTAGLVAVKRCGGIAVVQDPLDAEFPDMPRSALDNVEVDHKAPLKELGGLLQQLVAQPAGASPPVPREIREEARFAATAVPVADPDVKYMCPDCGGPLTRITEEEGRADRLERYRCMVGHAWSMESLLSGTDQALESAIWAAIRLFRQRSHLLASREEREREGGRLNSALHYREQVRESLEHARQLQELVTGATEAEDAGLPQAARSEAEGAGSPRKKATNS